MLRQLALRELAYRSLLSQRPVPNLIDAKFPKQAGFVTDPAPLKAAWCTTRAAKSYSGGIELIQDGYALSKTNCLYLAPTQKMARGIMWKDVLRDLDTRHNLGADFNGSRLEMTLPNESVIYLGGADCDEKEMDKLLGRKYKRVVIDECQMWTIDLRRLVYGVLKTRVADYRGKISMLGTSGNVTQGLYYDITRVDGEPREPGWSVHSWTALDNPYIATQWQAELDEIERLRPLFKTTALFRQWYLNEWVIDFDALVYKYNRENNFAPHLPRELFQWRYLLGVDLAHSPDFTAFVIACFHPADPNLYIVDAHIGEKMDFTAVAEHIEKLEKTYTFDVKVCDGANKQGLAEMNNRHRTGLIPAEKHGKVEYINLMNGELRQGKIKALPGAQPLVDQWGKLVWVTENGKIVEPREEDPRLHNDLCDAALYLWRYAWTYLWKAPAEKPAPGSKDSWEPQHLRRLEEMARQKQNPDDLELRWDESLNPENDEMP